MRIKSHLRLCFALGAALALPVALAACDTVDDQQMLSNDPPPPDQEEIELIPVIPDPQIEIWRTGYWALRHQQFVWVPGKIIPRPSPTAAWRPAHWVQHAYGWSFEMGHWE